MNSVSESQSSGLKFESLWPLAGFVLGCTEFKSSATLVKYPTGCLLLVGVFNSVILSII